jgi:hypothetical protein
VKTDYQHGWGFFTIRQRPHTCRCPGWGTRAVCPRGHQERAFKAVPIGGKPVTVVLPIPRVACAACQVIRQVPLTFADPRRSYTRAFERYAQELSRFMTIQDVAHHLGVARKDQEGGCCPTAVASYGYRQSLRDPVVGTTYQPPPISRSNHHAS